MPISTRTEEMGVLSILKIAAVSLFLGWAYLHLFWDVPYRTLFWSEGYLEWLVNLAGYTWQQYATSSRVNQFIDLFSRSVGVVLLYCAFVSLKISRLSKSHAKFLYIGSFVMLVVAFLHFKESGFKVGMFIEFAAQIMIPVILFLYAYIKPPRLPEIMLISIALTFIGHALFAVGYYPVPGAFIDMVIGVLGTTETQAKILLLVAGGLDILLSIAIFIGPLQKYALLYAVFWGVMTTSARPLSHLEVSGVNETVYWLAQALYRVPHAALPLAAYLLIRKSQTSSQRL
jgi:hypothetical protein